MGKVQQKKISLTINEDKTKFLIATNKEINNTFESVKQFKHLGTMITSSNNIKVLIKN